MQIQSTASSISPSSPLTSLSPTPAPCCPGLWIWRGGARSGPASPRHLLLQCCRIRPKSPGLPPSVLHGENGDDTLKDLCPCPHRPPLCCHVIARPPPLTLSHKIDEDSSAGSTLYNFICSGSGHRIWAWGVTRDEDHQIWISCSCQYVDGFGVNFFGVSESKPGKPGCIILE